MNLENSGPAEDGHPVVDRRGRIHPAARLSDEELKRFVEWIDLGATWDNIPGEDPLPGYDRDESQRLAKAAAERLVKPIADPKEAYTVRCFECHDYRKNNMVKQMMPEKIPPLVKRMDGKRKGWIKDSEIQPIIQYIQQNICKKK